MQHYLTQVHHSDGKNTYIKVSCAGTGVGAGLTDFAAVLVSETGAALEDFRRKGWQLQGYVYGCADDDGNAAAPGKELSATAGTGVLIYQTTESGFALQALIKAFKYWTDPGQNE